MKGGLKAWRDAGYEVFTGVNVPSKAFGEVVEHDNDTPRIDAADVQKLIDSKADMVILDSRPMPEFNNMSIPGGVDCPGAELVYRVKDFAPQSRHAGGGELRRPHALDHRRAVADQCRPAQQGDGAEERHHGLASRRPEGGARRDQSFGPQGPEAAKFAQGRGRRPSPAHGHQEDRHGGPQGSSRRKAARSTSSTCAIPPNTRKGHIKGFRHAAGGQLVQATDQYVGARNATIVLHDNDGVRATMTAHWLLQMDWNEDLRARPQAGRERAHDRRRAALPQGLHAAGAGDGDAPPSSTGR